MVQLTSMTSRPCPVSYRLAAMAVAVEGGVHLV